MLVHVFTKTMLMFARVVVHYPALQTWEVALKQGALKQFASSVVQQCMIYFMFFWPWSPNSSRRHLSRELPPMSCIGGNRFCCRAITSRSNLNLHVCEVLSRF